MTRTVDVGEKSNTIILESEEEIPDFLKRDASLEAFVDSEEILAAANMCNINIDIFTYGIKGQEDRWTAIVPDPEMFDKYDLQQKPLKSTITFYHCYDVHFE